MAAAHLALLRIIEKLVSTMHQPPHARLCSPLTTHLHRMSAMGQTRRDEFTVV